MNKVVFLMVVILFSACNKKKTIIAEKRYELIKLASICLSEDKNDINLFHKVKDISKFKDISDSTFIFCKVDNCYIEIDSVNYYLYFLQDGLGATLTGYWGISNDVISFIPFYLKDCPIIYPIFSLKTQRKIFKGKRPDFCFESNKYFTLNEYESITYFDESIHKVEITVLPLEGINIKEKEHKEQASSAYLTISLEEGILSFNYTPNYNYTILPWTWELIIMRNENINIDTPTIPSE